MRPHLSDYSGPRANPNTLRPYASWWPVILAILDKHGLTVEEWWAGTREHRIVAARYEIWWTLHRRGYSLPQIGDRTGGYDPSTVHYGVHKWEELRHLPKYANMVPPPPPAPTKTIRCSTSGREIKLAA